MDHVNGSPCTKKPHRFELSPSPIGSVEWQRWDEQLDDHHIARLIKKSLALLDLSPLIESYSGRGSAAYRPELMLGIVLAEKYAGNCSPSAWHRHQNDHISLCWIGEGICPARGVWYQFRDRVGRYLDLWLSQILKMAQTTGITEAKQGVIDGTLIAASASRHRLLNDKQLTTRLQQLHDSVDPGEESAPRRPAWMAKTPDGRLIQAGRFQRAKELLQPRLVANAKRCPSERLSVEQVVISASDPEAALAPDKFKVFRPLYNSILIADRHSQLILGFDVVAWGQDTNYLISTIKRTEQLTGRSLEQVTADAGFITGYNLQQCEQHRVELIGPWKTNDFSKPATAKFYLKDLFIWHGDDNEYECPAHQRLRFRSTEKRRRADGHEELQRRFKTDRGVYALCPCRSACTTSEEGREMRRGQYEDHVSAHRIKMATPEAKAISKKRGQVIERCFADAKEHRSLKRHTGRGLPRAKIDTGLTVLLNNLVLIQKAQAAQNPKLLTNP
jgi:transposase